VLSRTLESVLNSLSSETFWARRSWISATRCLSRRRLIDASSLAMRLGNGTLARPHAISTTSTTIPKTASMVSLPFLSAT